ncbi:hypothetical protein NDGK_00068 [Clostridiales bacterium CHKCI001]|nr:hypothetical protein NDGK_00068 [Clostridiales bacterium CHKCI001]
MEDLITKIVEAGIGNVIDKHTDPLLLQDNEYQHDCRDLDELEKRYMELDLFPKYKMIIEDYLACLDTTNCRANELYYIAGIRDAILFLSKTGIIKSGADN